MVLIVFQHIIYLIYSSSDTIQNNLEFVLIQEVFKYSHFVWKHNWNLVIGKEFKLLAKMSFESQKKRKESQ